MLRSIDLFALLYSLVAAVGFGFVAVLVTKTSRKIGPVPALFLFQGLGVPLFMLLIPVTPPTPTQFNLLPLIVLGSLFSFNYLLFLHATKIGRLAVVGPIGQLYMVVTAILGVMFLGEPFGPAKIVSMILIMVGVILLGLELPKRKEKVFTLLAGVPHSFISSVGTGVYLYFLAIFSRSIGWFLTVVTMRTAIAVTTFLILLHKRYDFAALKTQTLWKSVFTTAALDVGAFSLYNCTSATYEVSRSR